MKTVSIIVPSYNHRNYIGLLIDSIYAQTFKDFELIVVDDGSKDGSPEFLKELQARFEYKLILKDNEGLCRTLNKGLAESMGKYIITIGSDDIMVPTRLAEQVAYLEDNPLVEVVGGAMHLIDESGKKCGDRIPAKIGEISFREMTATNRVFAPTTMIRRSVFDKFGPYPVEYLFEDYYLWLKVLRDGGKIHNSPRFWAYYRVSNIDLEKKFNWYYRGAIQALAPYLSDPMVQASKKKQTLIFGFKQVLLLGTEARTKYFDELEKLNNFQNLILILVSVLPRKIRHWGLRRLKLMT
jgi:alpha-1,3-rhamnosyltransferase